MITVFHRFKKLEERLHVLSRDIEDIKKKKKTQIRLVKNENYKV